MRRLAWAVIRLYCDNCGHIIWFWQDRCRTSHSRCLHAAMRATYERNVERGPAFTPDAMWSCSFCGVTP